MTEDQLELLRDKYVLWEKASRTGNMELRDYNRRAAEALKALLSEREDSRDEPTPTPRGRAIWRVEGGGGEDR